MFVDQSISSVDVIGAAINTVRLRQRNHPLVPKQEAMAHKLEGILRAVGIDVTTMVGDTVVDVDALRASGFDVDALAADLRQTLVYEQ